MSDAVRHPLHSYHLFVYQWVVFSLNITTTLQNMSCCVHSVYFCAFMSFFLCGKRQVVQQLYTSQLRSGLGGAAFNEPVNISDLDVIVICLGYFSLFILFKITQLASLLGIFNYSHKFHHLVLKVLNN